MHLVLPVQPPMPPAQPYGGGYGADVTDHPLEGSYEVSVSEGRRVVRKSDTQPTRCPPKRTPVLPTIVEETPRDQNQDQLYNPEQPTTNIRPCNKRRSEVTSIRDEILSLASETNIFAETLL